MIVVAGWIRVAAERRDTYLGGCRPIVEAARGASGCVTFNVGADLIDEERVTILEVWDSPESAADFRGSGPSDEQHVEILDADVVEYTIADSTSLT